MISYTSNCNKLSPAIHKCGDEFIHSGLSAIDRLTAMSLSKG
jgi:hypothetical protein